MITLSDLLSSPSPVVRDKATSIIQYQKEFQAGMISKAEYDDLCADMLALDQIDTLASNVEDRQMIQEAFEALTEIASQVA
jgi:hypothetical protein